MPREADALVLRPFGGADACRPDAGADEGSGSGSGSG